MKIKTSWNLKLLYKSDNDPQIEKDLQEFESSCESFEKEFRGKPFTASPESLLQAYERYEKIFEKNTNHKSWWYFALKSDLDSSNTAVSANATKYSQRLTEAANKISFFILDIAKIPDTEHRKFLDFPLLSTYAYALKVIWQNTKYNLTEKEEQLEGLLSQTSYSMWINMQEKLLSQQTVERKGKKVPINEIIGKLPVMPTKERRAMHIKLNEVLKSISHVAEGEINAVYNYKKIMDKRRGYAQPYSATILGYENNEESIINFVNLVTKYFTISERFYKLHAKLLGEKQLTLADRSVSIGEIKTKFDFGKSVKLLRSVLGNVDKEYLGFFDSFLDNGQIDVFPKKGKRGGAYCAGMSSLQTFVFLNHVDDVRSCETLAHEMGHAIHTELSKAQPPRYQRYSIATAEVASTFFEQIMSDEIEKTLSPKEKVILLHNRLLGDVATIFRQIACFNFELELHEKIRAEGEVSKVNIAKLLTKHMRSYLGKAVKVTDDDGYYFVNWSHIRNFFYVYSYAYGQLISRALYENWKKDPKFAKNIKQFLSAGGSMSPEDIFKSIGVDTSKPEFFEDGLKSIERDLDRLEQATKGWKK